ncbi:MAG: hypothetical protein U0995_12020 [Erythrobacter sp.]|jgi:hypothetical protein|nr:hypothetical protein [Erythrobacter sp.]
MASFIISRPIPEHFRSHLQEAIETLGYYRMDALDQLLAMYRDQWPRGLSSSMFRIADIQPHLSEKGLADPYHAQKATHLRAIFNLNREEFDDKQPEWSQFASRVTFWARGQWLCEEARQRDQTELLASERWHLPLAECGQEWCPCHWTWTMDLLS